MGLETANAIMDASDWGEMTAEGIQALCLASAPWNPILRQPWFRRVYLVFFLLSTLLVLLPYWTLLYLPKLNRPRKSWTLKRCLRVRWGRRICSVVAKCEIDYLGRDLSHQMDPLKLTHSHPIVIPPAPQSYIVGHPKDMLEKLHGSLDNWQTHFIHPRRDKYASKSDVPYDVAPVTGFWFIGMKATPESPLILPTEDEPVMLHFHGGGYLCGTAAETDLTSNIPKTLVDHSPIKHVLSVDYRLSPTGPWPLPLIDAISAYHYLVNEVKVKERDIIIGGDSAGGHLALALTRWIRDEGAKLNLEGPRGLALLSPWTDLGFSSYWGPEAFANNTSTDVIDSTFGPFASSLLCRALPLETTHHDPYLSPSSLFITPEATGPKSMESFPSTFLVYGDAEVLSLPIVDLWKRLELSRQSAKPGRFDDELIAMPDSVHDFVIFPWQAEEASIVYSKLDEWLRTVLAKGDDGDDEDTKEQVSQEQQQRDSQWAMEQKIREQRRKRRESRQSLRITRSPVLQPRKERGVMRMVGDWSEEGLSIIDSPSLELDSFSLPSAETTREMLSPFTSQMEKGDWDIEGDVDGDGLDWFEGGGDVSEGESDDVEPRKDR